MPAAVAHDSRLRPRPAAAASKPRAAKDPAVEGLRTWVNLVDRFLDPILGLLAPGVGDVVGSMLGAGVIAAAVKKKLPLIVIARMLINLAIDSIIGAIPLFGDIFDFAFQANKKNLALLGERYETRRSSARDWVIVIGSALLLLAALVAAFYIAYKLASAVCSALSPEQGSTIPAPTPPEAPPPPASGPPSGRTY